MTTTRSAITVYCDEPGCDAALATNRTTTQGARGDADRAGWAVSRIYSRAASQDPTAGDRCPEHNPWRKPEQPPQAGPDLFASLPLHRTEAGWPNCSTCDGGGCPDCTDPA